MLTDSRSTSRIDSEARHDPVQKPKRVSIIYVVAPIGFVEEDGGRGGVGGGGKIKRREEMKDREKKNKKQRKGRKISITIISKSGFTHSYVPV